MKKVLEIKRCNGCIAKEKDPKGDDLVEKITTIAAKINVIATRLQNDVTR